MIRAATHALAWMPVLKSLGIPQSLQTSLRLRGAGYRRYCASASALNPKFHRHWYRHILVAYSPEGILPLPFEIWLGFPEGFLVTPYQLGMVRYS